ncbi:MAG: hypothetical protein WA840_22805 [Caulobacteraceae bacterium]
MMHSPRFTVAIITVALLATSSAAWCDAPLRVRGHVIAIDDTSVTIRENSGATLRLTTSPATSYADVVPSSLAAVKVGGYIGTAVKGPPDHLAAVEIVLVPESMRAGRIGFYAWDPLPDTSGVGTSGVTATNMTNGSISAISPGAAELAGPGAADGTVTADSANAAGRTLTVNLAGGEPTRIGVSSRVPIVEFVPSTRSAMVRGAAVVVWTKAGDEARLIAIGRGVTPPM